MAKRGYKLQEFVAHSADVNCVKIGKKGGRFIITGGDDNKVNLWSIGRPNPLMSLSGHTTPVESVAFDSSEVLIVAGASTGAIKLWDVEEAKIVRTLTGHRSYCAAVEFHPFGELLASGSMDTNIKIWDIRKKGCIHTYKGHTRGISNIRFSPDGRWVVSGGLDTVVKVWDLTAGKLLHDLKFHEGHIRSIDLHPFEFLLATGSADKTVKFWDLETFELIGSTRPEATGVRTVAFHPDGKTLFCGLDDKLKVFSWEPVICHDDIDIGWSTLGDLCTHEGKLLGCSHYQNSVGVWVADISLIDQYGLDLVPKGTVGGGQNFDMQGSHSLKSKWDGIQSTVGVRYMVPECEEIKNIYVDTAGENNSTRENAGSLNSPKDIFSLESKESSHSPTKKHVPVKLEASHNKCDVDKLVATIESDALTNATSVKDIVTDPNFHSRPKLNIKSVAEKFDKVLSPQATSNQGKANDKFTKSSDEISSVKHVNGVAIIGGRIRSLVERFERRETCTTEDQATEASVTVAPKNDKSQTEKTPSMLQREETLISEIQVPISAKDQRELQISEAEPTSGNDQRESQISEREPTCESDQIEPQISQRESPPANDQRKESRASGREQASTKDQRGRFQISQTGIKSADYQRGRHQLFRREQSSPNDQVGRARLFGRESTSVIVTDQRWEPRISRKRELRVSRSGLEKTSANEQREPQIYGMELTPVDDEIGEFQISKREPNEHNLTDDMLETHDVFLSTLRSRLTKLQVVRHSWERGDIKGAVNSLKKLPDHSVQADVVSVVSEKMEIWTLDLFSNLLPVLVGLLDSKTERHANISLEMLLKLVAVFGSVISSTVSAPLSVGVDIQAEQRLECCKQCFAELQKIQKILPSFIRRGGLLARSSQELNLLLQLL